MRVGPLDLAIRATALEQNARRRSVDPDGEPERVLDVPETCNPNVASENVVARSVPRSARRPSTQDWDR